MPAVGYEYLRQHLDLAAFPPARPARIAPVVRVDATQDFIGVPASVAPTSGDLLGHVLFALKHEGTDLAILAEALPHIEADHLISALRQTPSGRYLRVAGYLWKAFTALQNGRISQRRRDQFANAFAMEVFDAIEQAMADLVREDRNGEEALTLAD